MLDAIPPEALTDDVAILGKKGAGKSYAARGEVEALLELGRRCCVIDPTGVWFGLRLDAKGKRPSPYQVVIFGGDHGDVALDGISGARLAELIAGADFSCIIDTKRLTVGERTRIWTEFAERLAAVNRRPLQLIVDEAHLFAPQGRVNDPQSGRMVGATNNLVSGGRALGIRCMLLTQRPAKLHKDTLSGVETMVALRMVGPQDRAAIEDWIKDQADVAKGREIVASLASLPTGEGWIWSPQAGVLERVKFRPIRTLDSSRTPEDGERVAEPVRLESLDLALLQAALLAPAEDAPKGKGKSAARTGAAPDLAALERAAEQRGYVRGAAEAREHFELLKQALLHKVRGFASEIDTLLGKPVQLEVTATLAPPIGNRAPQALIERGATQAREVLRASSSQLGARLLQALQSSPRRELTWTEAAILAGVSPISGPFRMAKNALADSGDVTVTATGAVGAVEWRGDAGPLLVADDVVDAWRAKLGGMAAEILGHLFVLGPATKDAVAADLGRSPISGPWRGAWKSLRTNLLVEEIDGRRWRLVSILRELPKAVEMAR